MFILLFWCPLRDLLVRVPRSRGAFGLDDRFEEEISPLCKGDEEGLL